MNSESGATPSFATPEPRLLAPYDVESSVARLLKHGALLLQDLVDRGLAELVDPDGSSIGAWPARSPNELALAAAFGSVRERWCALEATMGPSADPARSRHAPIELEALAALIRNELRALNDLFVYCARVVIVGAPKERLTIAPVEPVLPISPPQTPDGLRQSRQPVSSERSATRAATSESHAMDELTVPVSAPGGMAGRSDNNTASSAVLSRSQDAAPLFAPASTEPIVTDTTEVTIDEDFEALLRERGVSDYVRILARSSYYGESIYRMLYDGEAVEPPAIVPKTPQGPSGPVQPATLLYKPDDIRESELIVRKYIVDHPDRFQAYGKLNIRRKR